MQIKEIFKKDISRPINGVVKADQLDESVVWQELDEYVVTRELDQHLRKFISAYLSSVDMSHDPTVTGRMGVWVSGFFGSGKSHFIKILSYLLGNRSTLNPETNGEKQAIDFFNDKIEDPMLLADLKRISGIDTDIILFNIDSRADASDGRSAILSVFWRVFNESQGFCGEYLHLAEIERYLSKKGKYEEFKDKFYELHGAKWEDERDAYALYQDEIVEALSSVLGKSKQAASDWFEKSEQEFNLTIENFAKRVKEYLYTKSKNHRIVFLVDEVGQFIGKDTHLMLNLQTIVEDLGRICGGRVWVLVTSQEDIDAVLGDIKASKANDFSKIQGRFNTRLSLSSSNTDEVIQARLLEKTEDADVELENLFNEKGDILKNQLSFSHDSTTLKNFKDSKGFIANYPFAPFHFQLIQNIFESIRKAGATGLHLARGERSMLDAFQSAAISLSSKDTGALVPLYEFFPCIENFLDTAVMLSINNAKENPSLEKPFDVQLLQTLFLIRYVELIKPNVDNLVTLCIDEVDEDRIDLKQKIEASLQRLEKQNLISRNGDLYFFLTNEEREVSREIKSVEISSARETQLLGGIIFDDILKGKTKHRYVPYKTDYPFNRVCDDRYWGKELKDELGLEVISPLHDEYSLFIPAKCNLHSSNKEGHVIVKLADDKNLISEIRTYLQTEKYILGKSDAAASTSLKQILRDRADENRSRKERLIGLVENLLAQAEYYALGRSLEIKTQTNSKSVDEAFDHLIQNVFRKFSYLTLLSDDPIGEIKQILQSDDIAQQQMVMEFEKAEPTDIKEIRTFIDLKTASNQPVILSELVRHFSKRPYGWGDLQIIILIAKFYMAGNTSLVVDNTKLKPKDAIAPLTKTPQWTGFNFSIEVYPGAGAFVCGEETALLASLEGKVGRPRPRPPYPAEKGLWDKPTCINNVETWANVPQIILKGSGWYSSIGTETSKGTKIFSLVGKINNTGLVEVPMGISLREIIFDIGGGVGKGKTFKAVQTGGPSGGCIPESLLDLPIDYDSLTKAGSIMGSGGMIVMDNDTCMVDVARYFLNFTVQESCGKCNPCRVGTRHMVQILEKICEGNGEPDDLDKLEFLAKTVQSTSLCGLGKTAPNPVLTTLKYFRHEYEAHIHDKRCDALICKSLISYHVLPEKCTGCQRCVSVCPTGAITGPRSQAHNVDLSKCIKCRACYEICRFDAIAGDAIRIETTREEEA